MLLLDLPARQTLQLTNDSLRRRANTRNVSFRISLRWPIYIVNSVDKTKLYCYNCFLFGPASSRRRPLPRSSRVRSLRASHARLSPFFPLGRLPRRLQAAQEPPPLGLAKSILGTPGATSRDDAIFSGESLL